jgi:crotonobetainyl-CoA:carnitine CoA-transferase CaiB-like acyl-CoA transferase
MLPNVNWNNMTDEEFAVAWQLDDEEQDLLQSIENGEWISVPNFEERRRELQEMAKAQLVRQTLEVYLSLQDADKISDLAEQSKIPVALLAQEIIHRYLGGELVEKQS